MPFANYKNFAACVKANSDKDDPEAYCATIMRSVEGKTSTAKIDSQILSAKIETERLRTAILQEEQDPSFIDQLKKTKDKQATSPISGDTLTAKIYLPSEVNYVPNSMRGDVNCSQCKYFSAPGNCGLPLTIPVNPNGHCDEFKLRTREDHYAKMVTGSMIGETTDKSGKYVSYFLLRGDHVNLKNWGVTEASIPHRIASFKGMPFVITSKKFFPHSPYGEIYDHPSTEHFPKLGLAKAGSYNPNDMMLQAEFQEHFRVGSIVDVAKQDKDWIAVIKIKPEFANYQMPPMVSPALFQLNRNEPEGKISTWTGMHLAGLDEKPAYGNIAIYKGSCDGPGSICIKQLTAKMTGHHMVIPSCEKAAMISKITAKIASFEIEQKLASMTAGDHQNVELLNVYKKKNQTS